MVAAPLTLLTILFYFLTMARLATDRGRSRVHQGSQILLTGLLGLGGLASWLLWEQTAGLTPGKHDGIKFIYYAWGVPFLIPAMAQLFPKRGIWYTLWIGYLGLVFLAALPIATYWR